MEVIQPPQIIIKYPGNLIKPEMKVGVACISEGYPAPEVKLFKTGSNLDKSFFVNDHEILIPSFMKEHEGEYKCIAHNTVGTVSETIKMKLKTPWISPSYQEVFSGESVTFSCLSNGAITWSGPDGRQIHNSERFRISKEGDLQIKKTFKTDSGRYKCDSEEGTHSAVVEVKSLPASFLQTPTSYAKIPIPSSWYDTIDIEFKFRTEDLNGTILYAPGSNKVDFFRIYLENGKLYTKWNLGSGTGILEGAQAIKIGKWYYVSVNRAEKYGTMSINGHRSSGQSPGSFTGFDFEHIALIGGGFQNSFQSYFGCLLDMSINGNRIDFGMLESEGLSTCNSGN